MKFIRLTLLAVASVIVLITLVGFFSSTETSIPKGYAGEYSLIEGLNIRVLQKGEGQDVLLIHGLPGSIEDWEMVIDELATEYRVTAYDRAGHGFSELDLSLANLSGNVEIAYAVIDKFKLRNVVVVGHSYGGSIAAQMAVSKPTNIAGFVSVAGAFTTVHTPSPIYHAVNIPILGAGIAKLGNKTIGKGMMRQGLTDAFAPAQVPPSYIDKRESMWLTVKNALVTAMEDVKLGPDLKKVPFNEITHRFHLIQGEKDTSVPMINVELFQESVPTSTFEVLDGVGHMIQLVEPSKVIQAVKDSASLNHAASF